MNAPILPSEEVAGALARRDPVVALETSVVAHGLPPPHGLEAARRCAAAVRSAGAVPAFVAVRGGRILLGADEATLAELADPAARAAKAQARDLGALVAAGRVGAATVSATVAVAARAGVRVAATGGVGGVHRIAPGEAAAVAGDVSADLAEIARQPVCLVCAGPKAVLDLPATAEALETLGIPVLGLGTAEMPAFFSAGSGVPVEHRVEDGAAVARILRLHWEALGRREGVLVLVPPPHPLPREVVEAAVVGGLAEARSHGIRGKQVTPFLLEAVARATGGRSREANLALLGENARVAGEVAAALASLR